MIEKISEHITEFILALAGLIGAITGLIIAIQNILKKRVKSKTWAKLKDHPIFAELLAMMNRGVTSSDITSDLKRKMVSDSLKLRMRGWYNSFMILVTHDGITEKGYIMTDGKTLSDWFYNIIGSLHKEQLEKFPKKYVDIYFSKYVTRVGETTARGVGEIFDNHNELYKDDLDKLWAIFTLVQDTLSILYTIGIETANDMNGELEQELLKNERKL